MKKTVPFAKPTISKQSNWSDVTTAIYSKCSEKNCVDSAIAFSDCEQLEANKLVWKWLEPQRAERGVIGNS